MFVKSIISKIFSFFPNGVLKDKARLYLYNRHGDKEFSSSKNGKTWLANYPGYSVKFDEELVPYHVLKTNFLFTKHFPNGPIDILVDAGAFIGSFCLVAAKKNPNIKKIMAFEPDPLTFSILKKNFQLNEIQDFELFTTGLWGKKETLSFFSNQKLASSVFKNENETGESVVKVEVDSLDNLLHGVSGKRIFVKMNIEGAEMEALIGSKATIENNKVHLAIAADHAVGGELTQKRVENICENMGLSITTFKTGNCIIVYASNEVVYANKVTI
jgi:FkbM family methyltransferase